MITHDKNTSLPQTANERFKNFYLHNFSAVLGFVQSYIINHQVSEDIVHESFFKLLQSKHTFTTDNDARGWIYTVARNLCLDYLRHSKFHVGEVPENYASDSFFLDEITRQEALLALRLAIAKLPPQTRKIAELTADGKTNAEMAKEMDISLNTVKTLKKEAYRKLRQALGSDLLPLLIIFLNR